MKTFIIIFYVLLTNISVGQTLKFYKGKKKFFIEKGFEGTFILKDSSSCTGIVKKLTATDIVIQTNTKENKTIIINDILSITYCTFEFGDKNKSYGRRLKKRNLDEYKYILIRK
jgi:hypothetical protein